MARSGVYVVPIDRAPETALIEPPFCRPPPLFSRENAPARCDLAFIVSEIASSLAAFTDFCCRFNVSTESI